MDNYDCKFVLVPYVFFLGIISAILWKNDISCGDGGKIFIVFNFGLLLKECQFSYEKKCFHLLKVRHKSISRMILICRHHAPIALKKLINRSLCWMDEPDHTIKR